MAIGSSIGQAAGLAASLASRIAGQEKSWRDRVKPAAYTSPSGKRITFSFDDLRRTFDIRGTVFEFPGVDGGYVQQTGFGSRQYPMLCYFTGSQCDLIATAFEAALLEPGIGQLEHPLYGTLPVVPFGAVERNDALKTAANQSVVTVTFFTTIGAIYPSAQSNGANEINAAIANFNLAAAHQLDSGVPNLKGTFNALSAIATIKGLLKTVQSSLAKISD